MATRPHREDGPTDAIQDTAALRIIEMNEIGIDAAQLVVLHDAALPSRRLQFLARANRGQFHACTL